MQNSFSYEKFCTYSCRLVLKQRQMCQIYYKNSCFFPFRHVAFLLQTMHDHLSDDEKKELSLLLEISAKQSTGSPKETDNNRMDSLDMPLIPLARMPLVRQCQRYSSVECFFFFWIKSISQSVHVFQMSTMQIVNQCIDIWIQGHCVVFLVKTLLSQCLSPPRCINGYQ